MSIVVGVNTATGMGRYFQCVILTLFYTSLRQLGRLTGIGKSMIYRM